MKTAVEWLFEKLWNTDKDKFTWYAILKQAKEMEREQIIEAHFNGCEIGEMFNNENRAFITDSEQYYNKTYKNTEQ